MKIKKSIIKYLLCLLLISSSFFIPVYAANEGIMPCFNYTGTATLSLAFDSQNQAHCSLNILLYSNGSGVSGLMKLKDASNNDLAIWAVRDYEEPISVENIYQCEPGQTYTLIFEGYVYGKSNLPADRIELSCTETCD